MIQTSTNIQNVQKIVNDIETSFAYDRLPAQRVEIVFIRSDDTGAPGHLEIAIGHETKLFLSQEETKLLKKLLNRSDLPELQ